MSLRRIHKNLTYFFRLILTVPCILCSDFMERGCCENMDIVMKKERFRHELKYLIGYADYFSLRSRLSHVMDRDENVGGDGRYLIRSIYFDNYRDKALREKVNGIARREKFRIRYYNDDLSFILLEKKRKVNNLCQKLDARITEEECRRLLAGDTAWMRDSDRELVRELYRKRKDEQLRPRVLVSYIREPYVYLAGNVRVTFDFDIRSTLFHPHFLEGSPADVPVDEDADAGKMVMEVKYDEYLPDIILDLIQTVGCRRSAFSKYGACRRFG